MIPGDRLEEYLYKWKGRICELWAERRRFRAIATFVIPTIVVGVILVLLFKGAMAVGYFLRDHAAQFFLVGFAICLFVAWLDQRRADKIKIEREEQEIRERRDSSDKLEAARTRDATYTAGAKFLFSSVRELGPLGIVPPATLSNIYSQGRTVPQMGGAVFLNVYLLQKDCESVDTDLIKQTLQMKIDQRLQAGEFPGIEEQHVYRGRVYSGFIVDRVRDSMGGFVEIYTTFVNDAYCQYLERRNLNSGILLPSVDRRDTDY